jgi:hypothetical protein
MNTQKLRLAVASACLLALVVGCGGDSTGPRDDQNDVPSGSLSFSYSGAISGNYAASGAVSFDASGSPEFGTWPSVGAM